MSQLIENIIFDLGGVLYAVDYQRTRDYFAPYALYTQTAQSPVFDLFETGQLSENEFTKRLQQEYNLPFSADKIIDGWNAMLLGLIPERIDIIKKLRQKYRLFLLSNTNEIHYRFIFEECNPLFNLFERCYFSHHLQLRKPNAEIFEYVLQENNLSRSNTLFIDDSPQHIEAARTLNLHTHFFQQESDFLALMNQLNTAKNIVT
ncbi:MAG: HAD family phosphatase [Bacteroidia bacterium]|nr:HAD family phosphatase [Bacteroidia bacterium]